MNAQKIHSRSFDIHPHVHIFSGCWLVLNRQHRIKKSILYHKQFFPSSHNAKALYQKSFLVTLHNINIIMYIYIFSVESFPDQSPSMQTSIILIPRAFSSLFCLSTKHFFFLLLFLYIHQNFHFILCFLFSALIKCAY